ncbi:MAG: insulinase family protein [Rhodothermaceae bacterium]|nr:insulinase family protein [Rhodothermaceae bacterium]
MNLSKAFCIALILSLISCATPERAFEISPSEESTASVSEEAENLLNDPLNAPVSDADELIPLDPKVRVDTLGNGLRYYIRYNEEPKKRAELRLVVNAGSLQEDDHQLGIAHFVEHMLFNGTERFEKSELVDFLERTGMRFGADVNAYTSFDETVYMLTIPTDSTDIFEKSFDILEDWAFAATLDPEEIDKERGVVVEEWRRSTQNAGGRIQQQTLPVLLHESRYEQRLPIGDTTILKNADYSAFKDYYRDWYRPDLMAVVAVGDFDMDDVESKIINHFGNLTNPSEEVERTEYEVPGHDSTLFAIITDPEYPFTTVSTYYKRDSEDFETAEQYRNLIVGRFFTSMLNKRLGEIARKPEPPFVGASVSKGSLVRTSSYHSMGAQVQDDGVLAGLESLLIEAKRVRDHGFTATELDRQKRQTLRAYLRAFNERETTSSSSHASEYVSHFLEAIPAPGIEFEYNLVQDIMPGITVEEINALAAEFVAAKNRVIMVTMPEKEGLLPPTEIELSSIFEKVEGMNVEPWVDEINDQPLISDVAPPGAITERSEIDTLGVTQIVLGNGIRVLMKPTDFKEDEVRFVASSPGGVSLVPDESFFEASNASMLVGRSGVGTFNITDLQKQLAGKVVSVSAFVSEFSEGMRGSASPEDLETMFQLVHLYATDSRVDSSALSTFQNQMRAYIPNRLSTPQGVFSDSLITFLYGDHPRVQFPTLEMVETLDIEEAHRFYKDRFADMSDFVFTFVGNFEVEMLSELAQTYLGNLPSMDRQETWADTSPRLPEGNKTLVVKKGIADQAQVSMIFHGPLSYDRVSRHRLRSAVEVLSIKLREELREELGGVYSVNAQPAIRELPEPTYQISVSFGCDPDRVSELIDAVMGQVEVLKAEGATEEELGKIKEQQRRTRETQKETNGFWVSVLDFYATHPEEDILNILSYEEMIESLTSEDVKNTAMSSFNESNFIKAVLLPESFEGEIEE